MSMKFKITARVISQLGAELISSDEIAIYELVKNGFDAGSQIVEVSISYKVATSFVRDLQELVTERTADEGEENVTPEFIQDLQTHIKKLASPCDFYCELTEEQVRTYAASIQNAKSPRQLISLLGRINSIEIVDQGEGMTRSEVEDYYFTIGTTHRQKQVDQLIQQGDTSRPPSGEKGIGRLSAMRLGHDLEMRTISDNSPDEMFVYVNWRDFNRIAEIEASEIPVDVQTRKKSVTKAGTYICIYDLSSDWSKDKIELLATQHLAKFIDPFDPDGCPLTVSLKWNGLPIRTRQLIRKYLDSCQNSLACRVRLVDGCAELQSDFVLGEIQANPKTEFSRTYTVADFNGLTNAMFEEVGPFDIDIYHFPRNRLKAIPRFASRAEVRNWLNVWCGGLMLFRDGVRVMPYGEKGDDWLNMDAKALRGKGFRVNRLQTVGCVRISRIANPGLIDQTNREGLRETPAFRYFSTIIHRHMQENFVSLLAQHMSKERADLDHLIEQVTDEYDALQECVDRLDDAVRDRDWQIARTANRNLRGVIKEFREVNNIIEATLIEKRSNELQILELAATGMAAESMAHDLEGVVGTALSALNEFSRLPNIEKRVVSSVRHIRSVHEAMLKQLGQISPGPAKTRRRASRFDVARVAAEAADFFASRMERHDIEFVPDLKGQSLIIRAVTGHVRQIFDNLFRNALFWLIDTQKKFADALPSSVNMSLDTRASLIKFSDTGIGIAKEDIDWIFKPFNTRREDGRGLGLYICRELAAFNEIEITVDTTEPNQWGRFNTFLMQFPSET